MSFIYIVPTVTFVTQGLFYANLLFMYLYFSLLVRDNILQLFFLCSGNKKIIKDQPD